MSFSSIQSPKTNAYWLQQIHRLFQNLHPMFFTLHFVATPNQARQQVQNLNLDSWVAYLLMTNGRSITWPMLSISQSIKHILKSRPVELVRSVANAIEKMAWGGGLSYPPSPMPQAQSNSASFHYNSMFIKKKTRQDVLFVIFHFMSSRVVIKLN